MKKLKTRCELNPKDCWDLTKVVKDEDEFSILKKKVLECNQKIVAMKGHILDDESTLWEYLTLEEQECRAFERMLIFAKLSFDEDTRNQRNKARLLEVESLANDMNEKESFFISEIMEKNL